MLIVPELPREFPAVPDSEPEVDRDDPVPEVESVPDIVEPTPEVEEADGCVASLELLLDVGVRLDVEEDEDGDVLELELLDCAETASGRAAAIAMTVRVRIWGFMGRAG
jgi:hypothetical protein